jgi:hypothetical protein
LLVVVLANRAVAGRQVRQQEQEQEQEQQLLLRQD